MTKALAGFKPGRRVSVVCAYERCAHTAPQTGILAEGSYIHPNFTDAGRFRWNNGTPVLGFRLREPLSCFACKERFVATIVVSQGKGKQLAIFGYSECD